MALLTRILVATFVNGAVAADEAPVGHACSADLGLALDVAAGGAHDYVELHHLRARRVRRAFGADSADEQAGAEGESDAGFEGDPNNVKTDAENTMPVEEAQSLDAATIGAHPEVMPQAPSMYPDSLETLDAAIAPKLQGLSRHSLIRLPGGAEVPYWQTHQYANRHFRLFITRWKEGAVKEKTFDTLSEAQKVRIWYTHARLRKIMCTETFRTWVLSSTFAEGNTPEGVYAQFEGVPQGSSVAMRDIPKQNIGAVANGRGVVFDSVKYETWSDEQLLGIYGHERSHNLGYSHESEVPYSLGRWLKNLAGPENVSAYDSHDLAQHPDFEVVAAS